jgi:hypothetical protein
MKQIFYIIAALGILFTSCDKEEELLFEKTAQERIKEKKELCMSTLLDSEKGWKVEVNPGREDIGIYNFLIKFDENKKAIMADDIDIWLWGESVKDSAYFDVKYTDDVEIVFETFSRFNYFYNPEKVLKGENPNKSLGGDIELLVKEIAADKIVCEGKVNGGIYTFTKTTTEDYIEMMNLHRAVELNLAFLIFDDEYLFPTIEFENGDKVGFKYNFETRAATFTYNEGDELKSKDIKITFDDKGVIFSEAISFNNHSLTRLDYDAATNSFASSATEEKANFKLAMLPPYKTKGLPELFNKIKFGPVTGKSKTAKKMLRALEGANERFTTLQFYNDPALFHGWAFKFSDDSEWPFVKLKDNKFDILDTDRIRFTPDGVYNEKNGTIDLNEVLKTPEGKALYDIMFAPEGFVVVREIACRLISVKDPSFWILVSNWD